MMLGKCIYCSRFISSLSVTGKSTQRCTAGAELPFQVQRVLVALAAAEWPHCSVQGSPWPAARRVRPSPKPDEFNEAHLAPLTLIGVRMANQLLLYRQGWTTSQKGHSAVGFAVSGVLLFKASARSFCLLWGLYAFYLLWGNQLKARLQL